MILDLATTNIYFIPATQILHARVLLISTGTLFILFFARPAIVWPEHVEIGRGAPLPCGTYFVSWIDYFIFWRERFCVFLRGRCDFVWCGGLRASRRNVDGCERASSLRCVVRCHASLRFWRKRHLGAGGNGSTCIFLDMTGSRERDRERKRKEYSDMAQALFFRVQFLITFFVFLGAASTERREYLRNDVQSKEID